MTTNIPLKYKQLIKFGIVGCVAFVFNYALLVLLTSHIGLGKVLSEIIAMVFSLQLTFLLHDRWTYIVEEDNTAFSRSIKQRYGSYLLSNTFGSLITIVGFALFLQLHFLNRLTALAAAAALAMIWNFTMNKLVVWRVAKSVSER